MNHSDSADAPSVSIVRIETAINVWRNTQTTVPGAAEVLVLDAETGKKIASFPTGSGTDAAGFDETAKLIFLSNGEGNITVIREKSPDEYESLQPVTTQQSAKTMALDKKTGTVYLPAATVIITPAADTSQKPKRTITDGSFCVLVVGQ